MQEPANMPLEVMCQLRARKQESIVYQFHNICMVHLADGLETGSSKQLKNVMPRTEILQSSPPISIPPIFPITALVVVAAVAAVFELAIDMVILDKVEEAVAIGIDIPLIDSISV